MIIFDDAEVISTYPLQQAIKDGILVEIFKHRWDELSQGKPVFE
jgi:type I site-specific restriction endonuclease